MPENETALSPEVADKSQRYERTDRGAQKRNRAIRLAVLAIGLVIITVIGYGHQQGWGKVVGVDALCPFGGIETLWSLITTASLVQQVAASSVVLLGIVLVTAFVFRRSFCGYICPLGAIQEFFGKAGSLVWSKGRPQMPPVIDGPARYLKYLVLVVFAVWSWQAAALVIRPYDPWVAWMHLTSPELLAEFGIGAAVLAISLIGSFVYDRFFCKYLCPMGAFLAVISPLSVFKVRRDAETCIDCGACDKACPVNVQVSTVDTVTSPECIDCSLCVNACPVKDTLEVEGPKGSSGRRVKLGTMAVLGSVVGIIALGLVVTTAVGTFAWTMPGLTPASAEAHPSGEGAGGTNGGTVDPASINVEDIKGSMTFEEVSKATGIPASAFVAKWGITEAQMKEKIKDMAAEKGYDVHTDFRQWVKQQLEAGAAK